MSENLRDVSVGIGFEDRASASLDKVDRKVDSVVNNFGSMGKQVSRASIGVADLGDSAKRATKDLEKIDKRHKLWQQTASGMEKVLHSNEMQTDALTRKIGRLDKELQNYPETLGKISKKYGENSKEVEAYKNNILDLRIEHAKLNKELSGLGAARMGQGLTKAGGAMTSAGSWMTTRVSLPILGALGASFKTFTDRQDAFSGVTKTVDGTKAELQAIKKELDYMGANTIPIATTELYAMAESAGQLGIKTKDITKFTSTVAKLDKTTNLGSEASADLAQFAGFTGMDISDIDKLGSTIVELGNNTETNEKKIVDMAMKIGAAGKQVKMSHSEIMGLSATISSLGFEAAGGGTAVSKLLFDMQEATMTSNKNLGKYAKVAKMTTKQFKKAFETNAAGALAMFTEGLGELQKEGANVIGILNDMGHSEVNIRDVILRTAGAGNKLNNTLAMGNKAWKENNALNKEFANISGNASSNLMYAKNKLGDIGEVLGENVLPYVNKGLDLVHKFGIAFGELGEEKQTKVFNGLVGAAVAGPVLKKLGGLAKGLGELNTKVSSVGGWGPYLTGAGAALKAFATGPVGIAIGALLTLGAAYGIVSYGIKNADEIAEKVQNQKANPRVGGLNASGKPVKTEGLLSNSDKARLARSENNQSTIPKHDPKKWSRIIGRNALGTNYWKGGLSELGERGTELVVGRQTRNLARGAKVVNARDTEKIFNNSTSNNSTVVQGHTFAPVIHVTLANGDRKEIEKVKDILRREFDPLMEDFFYRWRNKRAMAD
jgi:TP901 family phage tail tape measure protein